MMLDHVGLQDKATRVRQAVSDTLNIDQVRTGDLGGKATTRELTDALVQRVRNG
jgi:isocitrate dehydrogenase (NAD+)